jgi:hypothetical protein
MVRSYLVIVEVNQMPKPKIPGDPDGSLNLDNAELPEEVAQILANAASAYYSAFLETGEVGWFHISKDFRSLANKIIRNASLNWSSKKLDDSRSGRQLAHRQRKENNSEG